MTVAAIEYDPRRPDQIQSEYERRPSYMYGDLSDTPWWETPLVPPEKSTPPWLVSGSEKWLPFTAPEEESPGERPRSDYPLATGLMDYFPDALREVARCSLVGNEQHNPGETLHWDREKSTEHADKAMRHFLERGSVDEDGVRHTTKALWRLLALLQQELEVAGEAPLSKHNRTGRGVTNIRE